MSVEKAVIAIFLVVCTSCINSFSPGILNSKRASSRVFKKYQTSSAEPEMDVKAYTDEDETDLFSLPDLSSLSDTPAPPPFMVPASEVEEGMDDELMMDIDDPYGDILDMDAPIAADINSAMKSQWSIESGSTGKDKSKDKTTSLQPTMPQWEHWDAFMDEQFGDMDREISMNDEDKWVLELRDAVELKRGIAIWSKRSDEEVKREMKKYMAAKALKVPDYVANVVRCVYLERIMTMKEMRKENELDVINFRKWMIEKRKKNKKDPLPPAKLEVSKNWLYQHPGIFERQRVTDMPSVVMDEKKESSSASSTSMITVADKDASVPTTPTAAGGSPAPPSAAKAGVASGAIVTYSMLNWDEDVEAEMSKASSQRDFDIGKSEGRNDIDRYFIDNEEICVCTEGDYYIVM